MLGKAKVLLPLVLVSICNGLIADELEDDKINCRYVQPETVKNFINIGTTEETPRQILVEDFSQDPNNPYGGSIPISGGWGYTKDTSVIIDKYDPVVNQAMPFDGVGIDYTFMKNGFEELIISSLLNINYTVLNGKNLITNYSKSIREHMIIIAISWQVT